MNFNDIVNNSIDILNMVFCSLHEYFDGKMMNLRNVLQVYSAIIPRELMES